MSVSEKNVLAHSASGFNGQTPDEIGHKALKARVREFYIMSAKEKSGAAAFKKRYRKRLH